MSSGTVELRRPLRSFESISQISVFFQALSQKPFASAIFDRMVVPWMRGVMKGQPGKTELFNLSYTSGASRNTKLEQVLFIAQEDEFDFTWECTDHGKKFQLDIKWDRGPSSMSYCVYLCCDDGVKPELLETAQWIRQKRVQTET